MWRLLVLLLAHPLAVASDDLLAPTLVDLDRGLLRAERLLDEADVSIAALASAQASWVLDGCADNRCPADRALALVVAARASGHDARDLVQSSRAELSRVHRMAGFDAVRPLVDARRSERLSRLDERASAAAGGWSVRAAWYQRFMEPWARRNPAAVARACVPAGLDAAALPVAPVDAP